jgi:hypothetical protein
MIFIKCATRHYHFTSTRRNLLRNFQRLYINGSKPLEAEGFLRVS